MIDLADLPAPDAACGAAVRARAADILRPTGALARLDELAAWIGEWHGSSRPTITQPTAVIFAADHGSVVEGVSAYPAEVTGAMVEAFRQGVSSINAMARVAGATVSVIDVGVGRPTGNIAVEPALVGQRLDAAVEAGRSAVASLDTDLLVVGEMGIGNTTAAAAVCGAVLGGSAEDWVGRGTGVADIGLANKQRVTKAAMDRFAGGPPLEALASVGGAELVAMAAAIVEARRRRIPVLLDGFVVCAAAVALSAADPEALLHCRAGHRSAEAAHGRVLDALGMTPLLDLEMRLGEASGAMAAVPLVSMACAAVSEVPTFSEYFGEER